MAKDGWMDGRFLAGWGHFNCKHIKIKELHSGKTTRWCVSFTGWTLWKLQIYASVFVLNSATEKIITLLFNVKSHFAQLSHKLNLFCVATDEASSPCSVVWSIICAISVLPGRLLDNVVYSTPHNTAWALMNKAHIVTVHNSDRNCDNYF